MNKEKILGIIRHVLTFGAGYFAAKGLVDDATANTIINGLVALIGVAWSMASKPATPKP